MRSQKKDKEEQPTSSDTERHAIRGAVDVLGNAGQSGAHLHERQAARLLDHLQAAHHVALGVRQRFALFFGHVLGNVFLKRNDQLVFSKKTECVEENTHQVVLDERLQLEHALLAEERRGLGPGLEGPGGAVGGPLHLGLGRLGHEADELIGRRIVQVDVVAALRLDLLVVDPQLDSRLHS